MKAEMLFFFFSSCGLHDFCFPLPKFVIKQTKDQFYFRNRNCQGRHKSHLCCLFKKMCIIRIEPACSIPFLLLAPSSEKPWENLFKDWWRYITWKYQWILILYRKNLSPFWRNLVGWGITKFKEKSQSLNSFR